ncbi:bifunctional phosphopantothenoylcysteine decarboxylase/phosphopantothenate--cysteine ligase CoaBC [Alteromonas sp. ASW11-130]|uniref:bifunctional phosphopantothenoylcysteine decarboxylase/phosphopantothenate--cysteine ligase CoaBC n=1 Tax=Alteromonas sp. ASW11-130 TaxID=3015775 RepID=UPI002242A35E|nr:bifunctional phosphopantothenoylcysteine decarboxylase/phosphopantothenate--cysteine ligase CoaBC [Alteromonas sp. ASW11-130]MCW8091188.1 bifunctional phosphopantothenoylcysteine decarboxylase/phosphopantothenate--cysteine ligase CoaBC [Alteromonas sp. ASW11-130]
MLLANKHILLGVTGGIAAYKTPDLVRKLTAQGATVRVVITHAAAEFVSPMSLQAVSGNPVHHTLLDPAAEAAMGHIELAKWADILLIAPATANCLAKLAMGLADDLLTTLYLATTAKVILAPAMNQQMWKAPATQVNLSTLQQRGVSVLGPADGEQACGDVGVGRMLEPMDIVCQLTATPTELLKGKKVVITAGPTREELDPVRYITNHSSGKMGYAIAEAAVAAGARVELISGPVTLSPPVGCSLHNAISAEQMHQRVMQNIDEADIFIATAAVADYRPKQVASQKIKKNNDELTLTFVKNPDILKDVANLPNAPFTVGFAAESENVETYARKKLVTKKLAMIAANDISAQGLGFNSDKNALHVIWKEGEKKLPATSKTSLAQSLIALIAEQYNKKST